MYCLDFSYTSVGGISQIRIKYREYERSRPYLKYISI